MLSSSQSQLLSAEAEIVRSGDHAGPVCSSEKGIVITPRLQAPSVFVRAPFLADERLDDPRVVVAGDVVLHVELQPARASPRAVLAPASMREFRQLEARDALGSRIGESSAESRLARAGIGPARRFAAARDPHVEQGPQPNAVSRILRRRTGRRPATA